jgi:hypothetical protein
MSNLEKDLIRLKFEEAKERYAEREYTNLVKELEESDRKILELLEENRRLKKRNDELNEMNNLLCKEVIDDKNRFIKILEQRK